MPRDRAICPLRYVRSSGEVWLATIDPGNATDTVWDRGAEPFKCPKYEALLAFEAFEKDGLPAIPLEPPVLEEAVEMVRFMGEHFTITLP